MQFGKQERQREDTQSEADKAMAEMGSKLNVFKDPYLDRATESDDLISKIKSLGGNTSDLGTGLGGRSDML